MVSSIPSKRLSMKKLLLLLALLFVGDARAEISADRTSIDRGQAVTLSWHTRSTEAFLLGVGKVQGSGRTTVKPLESTDYILVFETNGAVEFNHTRIEVRGERGQSDFPDPDDFPSGLNVGPEKLPYASSLDFVLRTLQNGFHYRVRGSYLPGQPYFDMYTDHQVAPDLKSPDDRGIKERRVAYLVRIQKADNNSVTFQIRTVVEYRRLGEAEWRHEDNTQLSTAAAVKLEKALEEVK